MVSSNPRSKSQQKEGKKKQRQQQPSPAKRRRDKNHEICEPSSKKVQYHVANDLAQAKTESGQISPEVYRYLRKEMDTMINELRNSLLTILEGFRSEMRSVTEDYFRTVHLQRPNSEDECVSICTSLSSGE